MEHGRNLGIHGPFDPLKFASSKFLSDQRSMNLLCDVNTVYYILLKTVSLDNVIREFSLA